MEKSGEVKPEIFIRFSTIEVLVTLVRLSISRNSSRIKIVSKSTLIFFSILRPEILVFNQRDFVNS